MRAHRRFWIVVSLLVAAVLAFDAAYLAFGHAFVTRAYERSTRAMLRALIPSWAAIPLPEYLAAADRLAVTYSLMALAVIALLLPGAYAQVGIGRSYEYSRIASRPLPSRHQPRLACAHLAGGPPACVNQAPRGSAASAPEAPRGVRRAARRHRRGAV